MNPSQNDPSFSVLTESAKVPFNDSTRCLYRYSNGKRCRLTGSQPHFGLCPHHFSLTKPTASLELYNDAEDLTADLLPQLSELSPLSTSANFSPAYSLWSPRAASRLDAPPFSLTSPISSSTLTPAIIPENYLAGLDETSRIAPLP